MNTILIAEDNFVNRELLREMLEARNYRVAEARDGKEALAKIDEVKPDLVLLDLNMPILDGFAVIRLIRDNPTFHQLPVLAVTAYAMKEDRERVLRAGFDSYIPKPIDSAVLFNELKRFIS
jgi:two-component system cell cycle response regulator DivK